MLMERMQSEWNLTVAALSKSQCSPATYVCRSINQQMTHRFPAAEDDDDATRLVAVKAVKASEQTELLAERQGKGEVNFEEVLTYAA